MNAFWILLALSGVFLVYGAALLGRKLRDRDERNDPDRWAAFTFRDWQDCRKKVREWHQRHPQGPITQQDHWELENLIFYELGAYYIYCLANGQPTADGYSASLMELTDDWRK